MSSTTPPELIEAASVERAIIMPISTLSTMYFVYGFYTLLFGTCVYTMRSRQQGVENPSSRLYLSLTVVLFALSTIFMVVRTLSAVRGSVTYFNAVKTGDYAPLFHYLTHSNEKTVIFAFDGLLSNFSNIAANYMLIHRCYVIWGSMKRIALPLIAVSFLTNALGITSSILNTIAISDTTLESNYVLYIVANNAGFAFEISSAIVNSVITILTAGRIWLIYRKASVHGVHARDTVVQSAFRIILESGLIYPACSVANLIATNATAPNFPPFDFYPVLLLSTGIAPTLIMVRAQFGKSVESLQDRVSEIRFTSQPREGTTQTQVYSIRNLSIASAGVQGEGTEDLQVGMQKV